MTPGPRQGSGFLLSHGLLPSLMMMATRSAARSATGRIASATRAGDDAAGGDAAGGDAAGGDAAGGACLLMADQANGGPGR